MIGNEIPDQIRVGAGLIITNSDTLRLNDSLLVRGRDYRFENGTFDLSALTAGPDDTLMVTYTPLPRWLRAWYGREIPSATTGGVPREPVSGEATSLDTRIRRGQGITLNGAKSFRFLARSAGTSEFSQSLNMTISGELSPGLRISGAVTDRAFDPAYGTLNSRINELDKINIQVESDRLLAQLGDITVAGLPNQRPGKQVKGASFGLTYPTWHAGATAARPRGQFESVRFYGSNGFQGPYQVASRTSAGQAIVPGSETVWLDGVRLKRGAEKDYVMDYPTGRITFDVGRPIDARSRIEIDFEPLSTAFEGELFSSGGGVSTSDSTLFVAVGISREGDDKEQPEAGNYTTSELQLLASAGDSRVTRSGVIADTSGAYTIDTVLTDSLGDTVYTYVGEGNGEYSITFSFVGSDSGDYRFLGNGVYNFVGDGLGDYAPVVILVAPQRTDSYQAVAGIRSDLFGTVTGDFRQTVHDRNLYSQIDDGNNSAQFYALGLNKQWGWNRAVSRISGLRRLREAGFVTQERINPADFERKYLFPESFVRSSRELLHEVSGTLTPLPGLTAGGFFGDLDYENSFASRAGGAHADFWVADWLLLAGGWKSISAHYPASALSGDGSATNYRASVTAGNEGRILAIGEYERDRRQNDYGVSPSGTRFDRVAMQLRRRTEWIEWEYYSEDSLVGVWRDAATRNRLTAASSRRFGDLAYDLSSVYQWLQLPEGQENNFLARLNLRYDNARRRFFISSSYVVTEERRNARGIAYLEVEPGRGNYILEDGRYVPDPDGNFIQVEEILSDQDRVRRGEKSFNISRVLSFASLRFQSDIKEELLPAGDRSVLWALPFYSNANQPYLFFNRRYSTDLRFIPIRGFYALNISYGEELERRRVAGADRERHDRKGDITLRQNVGNTFFEESLALFSFTRDAYYTGSGADITGYRPALLVRQTVSPGELSASVAYRRADDDNDAQSQLYTLTLGSRLRVIARGELRSSLEFYVQDLKNVTGLPPYQLTDNNPGDRGINWSASINYGIHQDIRFNVSLSGRHANTRTARITGRGEVVAGF